MNSNELCTFQKRLLIIVPAYELLLPFQTDVPDQSVFHLYHSWCWSTLHDQSTLQWLQLSSQLQPNVRVYYHHDLVYLHLLPSAGAIEWRINLFNAAAGKSSVRSSRSTQSMGTPSCNMLSTRLTSPSRAARWKRSMRFLSISMEETVKSKQFDVCQILCSITYFRSNVGAS